MEKIKNRTAMQIKEELRKSFKKIGWMIGHDIAILYQGVLKKKK